ncbi:hypothetical protein R1flu_009770 [Riccia fluitans]|uniref:Mitochondrial carrier protein n=1 Tax=Riccia fluitans TaxID=41844 RepID=A0ABD1Z3V9_9MARC
MDGVPVATLVVAAITSSARRKAEQQLSGFSNVVKQRHSEGRAGKAAAAAQERDRVLAVASLGRSQSAQLFVLAKSSILLWGKRERRRSSKQAEEDDLSICVSSIWTLASGTIVTEKLADQQPADEVMGQGTNTAYCQTSPLYVEGNESASSALKSLAEEAKQATKDVKTPSSSILTICKSLVAGGVAGGVSRTAVAPLERLKILLQVQNAYNPKYSGMFQGLRSIWASEGLAGFFKGNGTNCARIVPNSAVKFYSYEQASKSLLWFYRQQTGQEDAEPTPLVRLGAGACAGIIAMSATYPMDMVRGRLTVQTADSPHRYKGMVHAFRMIIKEEGPRAVYKGWLPSVIGVVPYVGLNFAVYETLKDWVVKDPSFDTAAESELGVITKLLCGAAAGTVGQTVAYPLDVVRRRMQMVGWKDASPVITADGKVKAPVQYSGMVDAFRQTVRNEGFLALYKGLLPNSVKVVPSIALAFVTYEIMRDLLGVEIRISD